MYLAFDNRDKTNAEEMNITKQYINKHCHNLEYKLWDVSSALEFIDTFYPFLRCIMELHTNFNIVKCDFFRYLLMYHFGGLYTDLDFLPIRDFDQFIKLFEAKKISFFPVNESPKIILSEEWLDSTSLTNTLHNGILISLVPKHPFWLKLIMEIYEDLIIKKCLINTEHDVYNITGTKKLYKFFEFNKFHFKDVCILPYYYFCPYIANENNEKVYYNRPMFLNTEMKLEWSFFNINQHNTLTSLCPYSFFVCVYMSSGSLWK